MTGEVEFVVNIYSYTDYHDYLNVYFVERKKENAYFSHRYLCKKLGLRSTNFMLLVMRGKRNLSREICFKLSKIFRQNQKEADYFENMVFFSQSKNYREKDLYWGKMMELRQHASLGKLEEYQYDYFTNWYNIAIRELIIYMDRPVDYSILARYISPQITASQARKSVELLLQLGLIEETESGYKKKDSIIRIDEKVHSLAGFNFMRTMSKIAVDKLEHSKGKEKNFSSCSINISKKSYNKIIEKLSEFRGEIIGITENDKKPNKMYHLNLQFFPITEMYRKDEDNEG